MNSSVPQKKNKWLNQQIRKRYNRKQYKIKKYIHKCQASRKQNQEIHRLKKIKYGNKPAQIKYGNKPVQIDAGFGYDDYLLLFSTGYSSRDRYSRKDNSPANFTESVQSIFYWFASPYTPTKRALLDENDKMSALICGYSPYELSPDIHETIRKYSWYQPYSIECIKATHWLTERLSNFINSEENICPYSNNEDFNPLEYIYVRGGALRDCHLLREINDIDLVVDTHELCKRFLHHLMKYHLTYEQQKDCQCIYWCQYLKKFTMRQIRHSSPSYLDDASRILALKKYVVHADFVLNARFFVQILENEPNIYISNNYHGQHWVLTVQESGYYNNALCTAPTYKGELVQIDLVDGTDNSQGISETYEEYKTFDQLSKEQIVSTMNNIKKFDESISYMKRERARARRYPNEKCKQNRHKSKWISVPIYPFPVNGRWYDLTINCGHIHLQSVLTNCNGMDSRLIDYNWENKLMKNQGNETMNQLNLLALNDMNSKIIRCPSVAILNVATAQFYFWRFVKLAQKFIDKIDAGIWTIDEGYLFEVKHFYPFWFNKNAIVNGYETEKFLTKFMKWGINCNEDVLNRFKVFRAIGFEDYFKKILDQPYVEHFKKSLRHKFAGDFGPVFNSCFKWFGYNEIYNYNIKYLYLHQFLKDKKSTSLHP